MQNDMNKKPCPHEPWHDCEHASSPEGHCCWCSVYMDVVEGIDD